MAHKSTAVVSSMLVEFGAATATFGAKQVQRAAREAGYRLPMADGFSLGDETYGSKSMLYIACPTIACRRRLEQFLEARGVKIATGDEEYHPGSGIVEVQVSYFQGVNWDE